jgi:hypothetical protein
VVDQDSRTLVESAPQGWFHSALLPSGERSALYSGLKAGKAVMGYLAGNREALLQYDVSIMNVYTQFLRDRLHYYGIEQRWPDSLF